MMIFRVIAQEWVEPLGECLDAHDGGEEVRHKLRTFLLEINLNFFTMFK